MKSKRLNSTAPLAIVLVLLSLATGCDRRIDVDFNFAFEQKDYLWAEQLLEDGADIDRRYRLSKGMTNLMMAARQEWNPKGLEFLIDRGADVDLQSYNGRTALYIAAVSGRDRHVTMLLEAGADPGIATSWGASPLQAARDKGFASVERILLEAGVDE